MTKLRCLLHPVGSLLEQKADYNFGIQFSRWSARSSSVSFHKMKVNVQCIELPTLKREGPDEQTHILDRFLIIWTPFRFISVFESTAYFKFAKLLCVSSGFRCQVITGSLMRLY